MRGRIALAAFVLLAAAPPRSADTAAAGPPSIGVRLSWNARERTASGAAALARGDAQGAIPTLDTALRLRPDDPVARFNAGTARIAVEPAAAAVLLAEAAQAAPAELAPEAWYNLGNARVAAGDAQGAVEAFVETLRRRPDHGAAKFNLELALRELKEEKERQERQERAGQQQQPQENEPSGSPSPSSGAGGQTAENEDGGEGQPDSESEKSTGSENEQGDRFEDDRPRPEEGAARDRPDEARGGTEEEQGEPSSPSAQDRPGTGNRERPLSGFRDLPNMTAEQAAALLRAVDDLERRQRRERALRAARERARVEIDW